MIIAYNKIS